MSYYTERNNLRSPIAQTEVISFDMYSLLFDCCERFFDNIAWKYPAECPDGNGCCGVDYLKFSTAMTFDIPSLYKNQQGRVSKPSRDFDGGYDSYDQYALLDLIELVYHDCRDISSRWWHSFQRHNDISFANTRDVAEKFKTEINAIFEKTGLLYNLSEKGMVERISENTVLSKKIEDLIPLVGEKGIKDLLFDAIALYKTPSPAARQDSTEKIWDALERLKTYYTSMDKRASVTKIVEDMSSGQEVYKTLFNDEFLELTKIGNDFRIRHHETDKIEISDNRYYDYFFNRCLSLIALAIQYLQ